MQASLPACENTLKWASEQTIPSLGTPSSPDVSRSFAGPPRGRSVDIVIQARRPGPSRSFLASKVFPRESGSASDRLRCRVAIRHPPLDLLVPGEVHPERLLDSVEQALGDEGFVLS